MPFTSLFLKNNSGSRKQAGCLHTIWFGLPVTQAQKLPAPAWLLPVCPAHQNQHVIEKEDSLFVVKNRFGKDGIPRSGIQTWWYSICNKIR